MNDIFISNETWNNVVKYFAKGIFSETHDACKYHNHHPHSTFSISQISLFGYAKSVLEYYMAYMSFF